MQATPETGRIAAARDHGGLVRQGTRAPREAGLTPNDPFYAAPAYRWVFEQTRLSAAWSETVGSREVVIAVVDTGVDAAVPDLRGAVLAGYDALGASATAADVHGHGTQVASVLAARINNHVGLAGVCGRCSILPVRVAGADGTAPADAIARGIAWAADHGARVINVSLAVHGPSTALTAAVEHARAAGALVVAAAGNDGAAAPAYPAGLPGVVSVAASAPSGEAYAFSNHGPGVTLAAPGCAVVALRDGTYDTACGTSIAAPLVSGAAGLLAARHPEASADELAAALERGATRVGDTRYGRLNVAAALAALNGR